MKSSNWLVVFCFTEDQILSVQNVVPTGKAMSENATMNPISPPQYLKIEFIKVKREYQWSS